MLEQSLSQMGLLTSPALNERSYASSVNIAVMSSLALSMTSLPYNRERNNIHGYAPYSGPPFSLVRPPLGPGRVS